MHSIILRGGKMGNLFYEQLQKQSEPDTKIELKDISNLCKEQDICSNKCPFYDDSINFPGCLFENEPLFWNVKRIIEAVRKEKR